MPHAFPAAELVGRFRHDLAALGPVRMPICVALSGGPDSLALLLLARAAFPGEVRAATVDHRLRTGSADEAMQAARVCSNLGVPHVVLPVAVAAGASMQANARSARYEALTAWMAEHHIPTLLTAHHLDDQAETLVMRLARGSGIAGLAGIRARRPLRRDGSAREVLRPLLGWRRAELVRIVAASGLPVVQDPTNADERFDRVRIRRLLADTPALDPVSLARSAAALADAEDALEAVAAYWFAARVEDNGNHLLVRTDDLSRELRRRILLRCIARYAPAAPLRGERVSDALNALESGRTGTLGGVRYSVAGGTWRLEPAPPRRLAR